MRSGIVGIQLAYIERYNYYVAVSEPALESSTVWKPLLSKW